jgi:preprotein translocase subunit SecA
VIERRAAVLAGDHVPDVWSAQPARRQALVDAVGEAAVVDAERTVMLACIDQAWRDHLALCAELREGIHLVRLGGQDPLTRFGAGVIGAFTTLDDGIDEAVLASLANVRVVNGRIDLTETGLRAPSSTWTYLVNDDPFRDRLTALLTGPGGLTVAIYSALMLTPLLIAWGVIDRVLRRTSKPRPRGT